ncbi:hypothetical protein D0X99_17040 [Algoriphagus lacus]|uniref:Uncharacterized protein n=1 Tax=Algoriphagus lacus TaxID=2056311 RepID=A0A418PN80_9BACT|nr:hypothetical protein D0X99_17040 [Algoriphagus lacus]
MKPARWKTNRELEFGELDCKSWNKGSELKMLNKAATICRKKITMVLALPSSLFGGQKVTKKPWA